MSQKKLDIIKQVYVTLPRTELREFLHPDLVVEEPTSLPYGGVHHGRDTFLFEVMPQVWRYWNGAKFEVQNVFDADPWVVGMLKLRGHSSLTNEDFEVSVAEFWLLDDDGLVTLIRPYYFDTGLLVGPYDGTAAVDV